MTLSKKEQLALKRAGNVTSNLRFSLLFSGFLIGWGMTLSIMSITETSFVIGLFGVILGIIFFMYEESLLTLYGIIGKLSKNSFSDTQSLHQGVDFTLSKKEQFALKIGERFKKHFLLMAIVFFASIFTGILECIFWISDVGFMIGFLIIGVDMVIFVCIGFLLRLYGIIEKLRRDSST
ncbi:MAG: hypothetical protein M1536_00195 [Firmicutes bacterium]|nr:hypothetical protein [Bacillota bacterium]